jgi:hypothetical protein
MGVIHGPPKRERRKSLLLNLQQELVMWVFFYIIFTVHFLTAHELHTHEMLCIFHFLVFNPYKCFGLYKAIFSRHKQ